VAKVTSDEQLAELSSDSILIGRIDVIESVGAPAVYWTFV